MTRDIRSVQAPAKASLAYTGRYAPSPTGPLHKGSLVAALASFLQARSRGALWKMRIDDLDTPRIVPGAAPRILCTLEDFGLVWDGPVLYQSQRAPAYDEAIRQLRDRGRVFDCGCTRRQAQSGPQGLEGPIYPGTCRNGIPQGKPARSLRVIVDRAQIRFVDQVQGCYRQNLMRDIGDFVVRRADGRVAYQLATVVDDAAQGVGEVVRGADLLSSTPRQIHLQTALDLVQPVYAHVPLVVDRNDRKLGKRNGALALDAHERGRELVEALDLLGQAPAPELALEPVDNIIAWATARWRLPAVPMQIHVEIGRLPATSGHDPIAPGWPSAGH